MIAEPPEREQPQDADIDARFQEIIAGWDFSSAEHPEPPPADVAAAPTPRPPLFAPAGPRDWVAATDPAADHFQPAEPPRVINSRWRVIRIFILLAISVLGIFLAPRIWPAFNALWYVASAGAFIMIIVLFLRNLPSAQHNDDDGAVL